MLVDSVAWQVELGSDASGTLHRVAVLHGDRADTIPSVLTDILPVLVGDSIVVGLAKEADEVRSIFQYNLRSGQMYRRPLPRDLQPALSAPALSPDARFLGYVTYPGDDSAQAIIRERVTGREIFRSAPVHIPATNFAMNSTRWRDPQRFEFLIDRGGSPHQGWERIEGRVP